METQSSSTLSMELNPRYNCCIWEYHHPHFLSISTSWPRTKADRISHQYQTHLRLPIPCCIYFDIGEAITSETIIN